MSQRNTPDTLAWLKHQHDIGASNWKSKCLMLQREARGLPSVFPSALAAANATPMSERVYDISKVQQGMVGYADDPNDSNPFGHIYSFRAKIASGWVVWTNDALGAGRVWCVGYDWFRTHWGDSFKFAATSLNGFDLLLPSKPTLAKPSTHPAPPVGKATLTNLDYAIHRLDKAIVWHEKHHHPVIVRELKKDRARIVETKRKHHL